MSDMPMIVCLCGSVRFADTFRAEREAETLAGRIVVGPEILDTSLSHSAGVVKRNLDELHLRKIDLADEVLIVSCEGYIGDSTFREIQYAQRLGKPVRWLEPAAEERFNGMAQRGAAFGRDADSDSRGEQTTRGLASQRGNEREDSDSPSGPRSREAAEARTPEAGQKRLEVDR